MAADLLALWTVFALWQFNSSLWVAAELATAMLRVALPRKCHFL
jgi:hypothetical protein